MSTRVRITIDDRPHEAVLKTTEDGALEVEIDGVPVPIKTRRPGAGPRSVEVETEGTRHHVQRLDLQHVMVDGELSTFRVEEVRSGKAGAQVPKTGLDVRPPMPGRIVRLGVAEGDTVEEGGMIGVLEAMKMQNELTSPASGTVRRILVAEGDTVEADQVILQLGPLEEEPSPEKKVVA